MTLDDDGLATEWHLLCANGRSHDWRDDACVACGCPSPSLLPEHIWPVFCGYIDLTNVEVADGGRQ